MTDPTAGAAQLLGIIRGNTPSSLPYDEEAEVLNALSVLEYSSPREYDLDAVSNAQQLRSRVRYLAALFPDTTGNELVHRVHGLLNNKNFDIDDLRLVLQGRRLNDPSRATNEVPLTIIQGIGRCLRDGMSLRSTAREMRVSYDTVEAIERYLGLRAAREAKIQDAAVDAARENISVRAFANRYGVSRSKAHRLLTKGKSILNELGE